MEKKLFPNETDQKIIKDNLLAMSDKTEVMVFRKPLGDDERTILEREFIQRNVALSRLKKEFEKIKEEFKNKMKPIEKALGLELETLEVNSKQVEEQVFMIADQEEKIMNIYDQEGNLITMRPLTMEERQTTIHRLAVNN